MPRAKRARERAQLRQCRLVLVQCCAAAALRRPLVQQCGTRRALDGMLTGFAVVCATDGGGLSWEVVPTVGVASVLAGAISMGVGEYLGSIAETEHALEERKREKWELSSNPDGEKREMVEIFAGKGMSVRDATSVIDTLAKYEDLFLEIMLKHELGLDISPAQLAQLKDNLHNIDFAAAAAREAKALSHESVNTHLSTHASHQLPGPPHSATT